VTLPKVKEKKSIPTSNPAAQSAQSTQQTTFPGARDSWEEYEEQWQERLSRAQQERDAAERRWLEARGDAEAMEAEREAAVSMVQAIEAQAAKDVEEARRGMQMVQEATQSMEIMVKETRGQLRAGEVREARTEQRLEETQKKLKFSQKAAKEEAEAADALRLKVEELGSENEDLKRSLAVWEVLLSRSDTKPEMSIPTMHPILVKTLLTLTLNGRKGSPRWKRMHAPSPHLTRSTTRVPSRRYRTAPLGASPERSPRHLIVISPSPP